MKKVLDQITAAVSEAFERAGFDSKLGKCTVSIDPTCASTSAMALWPEQSCIIKPPL